MFGKISSLTAFLIIIFFLAGSILIILYQLFTVEWDIKELETMILPIEEIKLHKEEVRYEEENGF